MNCPHCKRETKTRVKETRLRDGDIVRSRECHSCGNAFGTKEVFDAESKVGEGRGTSPASQKNIEKAWPLHGIWK